jgi:hypothetical protein
MGGLSQAHCSATRLPLEIRLLAWHENPQQHIDHQSGTTAQQEHGEK